MPADCPKCGGEGYVWQDDCDICGEHHIREETCRECDGTGSVEAEESELLAALDQCIKALEVATTPLPEDRREVLEAQVAARAAIAKARGGK